MGAPSPAEAVADWVKEGDDHQPVKGWSPEPDSGQEQPGSQTFVNGDWRITVTTAPGGGWLVTSGQTC